MFVSNLVFLPIFWSFFDHFLSFLKIYFPKKILITGLFLGSFGKFWEFSGQYRHNRVSLLAKIFWEDSHFKNRFLGRF